MSIHVAKSFVCAYLTCSVSLVLCYSTVVLAQDGNSDVKPDAGHLLKFGEGRPVLAIDEVEGFPAAEEFFHKYVLGKRPLKMRNAAGFSRALKLWTDEYFLKIDIPEYETVQVESMKKEDRKAKLNDWHFHEFIRKYNQSDVYLVEDLPYYLAQDVILPCPLQCDDIEEYLSQTVMWMNSGGTSSVIHTDEWNNFNCLFRGDKEFRLMDSTKYNPDIIIDVKRRGYSSADVDRVDFVKFPGLANVEEYYHVNITAGDCLYLPVKWVHQVRSYGSNVAVNVWFRHEHAYELGTCKAECDVTRTMDIYDFTSPEVALQSPEKFKELFTKLIYKRGAQSKEQLIRDVLGSGYDDVEVMNELLKFEDQIFSILDRDKDDMLDVTDLAETTWKGWVHAHELFKSMAAMEDIDDGDIILDADDAVLGDDETADGDIILDAADDVVAEDNEDGRDEL